MFLDPCSGISHQCLVNAVDSNMAQGLVPLLYPLYFAFMDDLIALCSFSHPLFSIHVLPIFLLFRRYIAEYSDRSKDSFPWVVALRW